MALDLFNLAAKLSLDDSEFNQGMDSAEKRGSSLAGKLASGVGTAAKVTGAAVAAAGTATLAFAKSSVDAGMSFDKSMSQVAATMGKTTDEIQDLRKFAMEMGSTTAFSATEAADALNYMALAGYDSEKSMKMLPTVLDLAAAGGIDLAQASDMVTDAQSALGLSLEETSDMVDKMAKASSKSNTSVAQLGEAFLTVGGTAKNLKGGTTELSQVLGLLADNGIKGAEGGTALRNMVLSLSAPTDKAAKALKSLGVQVFDNKGNMRSMEAIFGDMNKQLSGMSQKKRTEVLNEIFNKVDLKSVNALLGTNADRWKELASAIDDSNGAAKDMAKTQLDNLAGDITLWKSALEGAKITLSDQLTPTLRTFVKIATDGVSEITTAFQEGGLEGAIGAIGDFVGNMANQLLQTVNKILPVAGEIVNSLAKAVIDNLPMLSQTAIQIIMMLVNSIVENLPKMVDAANKIIVSLIKSLTQAIPKLIPVAVNVIKQLVNGLRQNMNQIGLAAYALIKQVGDAIIENTPEIMQAGMELVQTLVEGIVENIPGLLQAGMNMFSQFTSIFFDNVPMLIETAVTVITTLVDGITENLPRFIELALSILTALIDGFAENMPILLNGVLEIVTAIGEAIEENLPIITEAALTILTTLITSITENLPTLIDLFIEIMMTILNTIVENLPMILDAAMQIVDALVQGLIDNINTIIDGAIKIMMAIFDTLIENMPKILEAALQIITALADALIDNLPVMINKLPEIIDSIKKKLTEKGQLNKIIDAGIKILTSLIEKMPKIVETIVDKLPDIINGITNFFTSNIDTIINAGVTLLSALIDNMDKIVKTIADALPKIITQITTTLLSTENLTKIINAGFNLLVALVSNIGEIAAAIVEALPQIVTAIGDFFAEKWETMKTVGKNLIEGIFNGINDAIDWVKSQISNWVNSVIGFFKDLLGIHSPSTVMRDQIGIMMGRGVAEGIVDSIGDVEKAGEELLGSIPNVGDNDFSMNVKRNLTDSYTAGMGAFVAEIQGIMSDFQQTIVLELDDRELGRAVRGYV